MTDGIATGWHHAVWLLGYVLGAALPIAATLVAVVLVLVLAFWGYSGSGEIAHRARVVRLRRQNRRSGRTT